MVEGSFWQRLDELLTTSKLVIDRPEGSTHPRYPDVVYPLDYGYLEHTSAGDGDGIDVWVGSLSGNEHITAAFVTVDLVKRDLEVKLLLNCSDDDIKMITAFHSGASVGWKLFRRDDKAYSN